MSASACGSGTSDTGSGAAAAASPGRRERQAALEPPAPAADPRERPGRGQIERGGRTGAWRATGTRGRGTRPAARRDRRRGHRGQRRRDRRRGRERRDGRPAARARPARRRQRRAATARGRGRRSRGQRAGGRRARTAGAAARRAAARRAARARRGTRRRGAGAAGTPARGGSTGVPLLSFYIGADVTDQETQPDATRANLLTIMKSHGFNYIRLRTFVDPKAADGYDKTQRLRRHRAHRRVRQADQGRGHGPAASTFTTATTGPIPASSACRSPGRASRRSPQLATAAARLHQGRDHSKLIAGGARPDMVQIGNEITPGMLIHRCDSGGQPIRA